MRLLPVLTMSMFLGVPVGGEEPNDGEGLIGDWELVAVIEDGLDVTGDLGVTRPDRLIVYTFSGDRTFSISRGGDWFESGTWVARDDTVPKQFDHTPTEAPGDPDIVGIVAPGIYELGGNVAKICVAKLEDNVRPTDFNSNRCVLYVVRRVAP